MRTSNLPALAQGRRLHAAGDRDREPAERDRQQPRDRAPRSPPTARRSSCGPPPTRTSSTVGEDGDIVKAIAEGTPGHHAAAQRAGGRAIAYSLDGTKFLTLSAKGTAAEAPKLLSYTPYVPPPPAPVDETPVRRGRERAGLAGQAQLLRAHPHRLGRRRGRSGPRHRRHRRHPPRPPAPARGRRVRRLRRLRRRPARRPWPGPRRGGRGRPRRLRAGVRRAGPGLRRRRVRRQRLRAAGQYADAGYGGRANDYAANGYGAQRVRPAAAGYGADPYAQPQYGAQQQGYDQGGGYGAADQYGAQPGYGADQYGGQQGYGADQYGGQQGYGGGGQQYPGYGYEEDFDPMQDPRRR